MYPLNMNYYDLYCFLSLMGTMRGTSLVICYLRVKGATGLEGARPYERSVVRDLRDFEKTACNKYKLLDGMIIEKNEKQGHASTYTLHSPDRVVILNKAFLNRCEETWANTIRDKINKWV